LHTAPQDPVPPPPPPCNADSALKHKNKDCFNSFDTDSSGGLSYKEYSKYTDFVYEDMNSIPPKELCDSNGDEEATFAEYEVCVDTTDIFMYTGDRENLYYFDLDKSGGLSTEEFRQYYQSLASYFTWNLLDNYVDIYFDGGLSAELTNSEFIMNSSTLLDMADTDRDGSLSKREFVFALEWTKLLPELASDEMVEKYFVEGDVNADGKLSSDELNTLLLFVAKDKDGNGKVCEYLRLLST
jgi:Ca2+-binding EF-hand superfamily protein